MTLIKGGGMSGTLNAKEDVEILADKDPGVGLPGRVYLPGYSLSLIHI